MNFKSIYTVPADVTVMGAKVTGKGLRPVGRQTLTGTDYAEISVEKAVKTGRATIKLASARTKVAYKNHRTNVHSRMEDRKVVRELRKEQKAHNKAMKAQNEAVVENNDEGTENVA